MKLASTGYLDTLPTGGNKGGQAFRDIEMEEKILQAAYKCGFGAQFGGKHFALDVRVIRLPRHGASCPLAMGVSCSADRNIKAKINRDGIWLEEMEKNPGRFIPDKYRGKHEHGVVKIDLNRPMKEILAELTKYPVTTQRSLTGTIVVGRDIAHAKIKERIDGRKGMPQYLKDHPIYYAGPAKTPKGMPSGSFRPTTAGRMDSTWTCSSRTTLARHDRQGTAASRSRTHAGSTAASTLARSAAPALLAQENIRKVEVLEYPERGWRRSGRSRSSTSGVHPGGRQGERLLQAARVRTPPPSAAPRGFSCAASERDSVRRRAVDPHGCATSLRPLLRQLRQTLSRAPGRGAPSGSAKQFFRSAFPSGFP